MNYDLVASLCCGITALCVFWLHSMSCPKMGWVTLPGTVRLGLGAVGATYAVRSADFIAIAYRPDTIGHINIWGLCGAAAMAYLAVASAAYVLKVGGLSMARQKQLDYQRARAPNQPF